MATKLIDDLELGKRLFVQLRALKIEETQAPPETWSSMKVRGSATAASLLNPQPQQRRRRRGPVLTAADVVAETKEDGLRLALRIHLTDYSWANTAAKAARAWPQQIYHSMQKIVEMWPELERGTIFDGEAAMRDRHDRDRRGKAMSAIASNNASELQYTVFDLPWCMGVDISAWPLRNRRALLAYLFSFVDRAIYIGLVPQFQVTETIFAELCGAGYEGCVYKEIESAYVQGESSTAWSKEKEAGQAEGVIIAFAPGAGKYADTVGAVKIGQYFLKAGTVDEYELKFVTQVSGMTDLVRRSFTPADIGRVCAFTFQNQTSVSYNHPQWAGFRDDKPARDCRWRLGDQ